MSQRAARRRAIAGLVVMAATGCTPASPGPVAEQAALGGEIAARVGADVIPVALVAKVASDQHVTPRVALQRLVDDAICANAARTRGLDRVRPAAWLITSARARSTADRILLDAKKAGPPTDAEIEALTARYWREVDRPPAVKVVHAVVKRPKTPGPEADARARAFAETLRSAVISAKTPDEFQTASKAVPHPPEIEVVVETLPPIADDGYVTDGEGRVDGQFAKGAFAVAAPGETSPVVESESGWHVIRLVERVPEQRMPLEGRRVAFAEAAVTERARTASDARSKELKTTIPIEVSPSAELLMRSLFALADRGPAP